MTDVDADQMTTGVDAADPAVPDPDAPHGRCLHCRGPLPPPKATGRPREYHARGHGPGGVDCREAARRARSTETGIAIEQPLTTLIAAAARRPPPGALMRPR